MRHPHIIRRTEKLRQIRALLEEGRVVCLSSFFYSGKTALMNQLAEALEGPVERFEAEKDDWPAFEQRARALHRGALLIDGLNWLPQDRADALAALLTSLPEGVQAVLAGRAQLPAGLKRLCATGEIALLDKDFMMFTVEETEQLFLDYGIRLTPQEIGLLQAALWCWPFATHLVARKRLKHPERTLSAICQEARRELMDILISDVVLALPEQERMLLYSLSPFERFSADMARMVTGRADAPRMMSALAQKSYILFHEAPDVYYFIPFVRMALFEEMKNFYSPEYIDGQYRRAALYCELQNRLPEAIAWYTRMGDREKIRELLIRDTHKRPASGDYTALRPAYALLSEDVLRASPELMKGMCIIESLLCRPEESERWYAELKRFARETPARDARRRAAEEALAYLDICLPHRGTGHLLNTLVATARLRTLTQSDSWRSGFSVAGNGVSLLNGGKDFCRWVPHGRELYRLLKGSVERALGRGGSGMADIALAECALETDLTGDYGPALEALSAGLSRASGDLELRCAALGIQSRIAAAQGDAPGAIRTVDHLIASLPEDAPPRLIENLRIHRLWLLLLTGETREALDWLKDDAPDDAGEFMILDRYRYLLKLRLRIISGQWPGAALLCARLRHYLDSYDRPYMRIQLHLLEAVIHRRGGREQWRSELEAALALARRYRLIRVIADEGVAIVDMLGELDLPEDAWSQAVLRLTRAQAARYPACMKPASGRPLFTDREYQVYSLMLAGYKNAKIAAILSISERTVKHYTAEIYRKLGVATRSEALSRAAELGDVR